MDLNLRLSRTTKKRMKFAVFGGLFSIALVLAGNVVAIAADDDDDDTFEQKIIKGVLGGLGVNTGGAGIDYRERSPLVIPPNRDLPKPDTNTPIVNNPAWPKDPDQVKRAKAEDKIESIRIRADDQRLLPNELNQGAGSGAKATAPADYRKRLEGEDHGGAPLPPSALNYQGGLFDSLVPGGISKKNEQAQFTGEPARTTLVQPPAGYQTPSPSYHYGLSSGQKTNGAVIVEDRAAGTKDQ